MKHVRFNTSPTETFRVGVDEVDEVIVFENWRVTTVDPTDYVVGMLPHRGNLVTVIDVNRFLGRSTASGQNFLVVVRSSLGLLGLLAGSVDVTDSDQGVAGITDLIVSRSRSR